LKILVSAFSAKPGAGSESAVGWEWIKAISRHHSVWAVTWEDSRAAIERYKAEHPNELSSVSFFYLPYKRNTHAGALWLLFHLPRYARWQKQCLSLAKSLDAEVKFDIIHHVTNTGFREPGYLWKLGKPFVWGPMGGLHYFSPGFLRVLPFQTRLFIIAKNATTAWTMYCARRPRRAARAAACIISASQDTALMVRKVWGKKSIVFNSVTPPEMPSLMRPKRKPGEPLRIVWCGRIDVWKALNLLLAALGRLSVEIDWELRVIGDGPIRSKCEQFARQIGIWDRCMFLGRVPKQDAIEAMRCGHVLAHTSLYELAAPTVVVEALSVGLPVIGLDHCGFSDTVDEACGIAIPVTGITDVVNGLANAIRRLWYDEEARYRMALAAQVRAQQLSWCVKADKIGSIYANILDTSPR
jgi:glycosyltransferase involved in cell wall biosynthesis